MNEELFTWPCGCKSPVNGGEIVEQCNECKGAQYDQPVQTNSENEQTMAFTIFGEADMAASIYDDAGSMAYLTELDSVYAAEDNLETGDDF
jgi:hypothetical protein